MPKYYLLADVVICPDGFVKVVDLDELAIAMDKGTLSEELLCGFGRRGGNGELLSGGR